MTNYNKFPRELDLPLELIVALAEAAAAAFQEERQKHRIARRPRKGATRRPGTDTPLWNALVTAIRPHLSKYGAQVNLGRQLGLPRQQINAFFVARTRLPDAETTLQLLAWLIAVRKGQTPA